MSDTRKATITRKTKETDISCEINIDGVGESKIDTGIGFFDHMLEGFSKHGFFDLNLTCKGDLVVDCHHTKHKSVRLRMHINTQVAEP